MSRIEASDSLTAEEYLRMRKVISGHYSVALTDCGTGVTHNAMIVVITYKDEVSSRVDKDAIEVHLSGSGRQVIAVPHDRGVAEGDLVTLDALRPQTRRAYKEIAAAIVDGYVQRH